MFIFSCPDCNVTSSFKFENSYNKRMVIGKCSECSSIHPATCKRCNHIFNFKRYAHIEKFLKNGTCVKCKPVPDDLLDYFKSGKLVTMCECCNRPVTHFTREKYIVALRLGSICVKCDINILLDKISHDLHMIKMSPLNRATGKALKTIVTRLHWRKSTGLPREISLLRAKCGYNTWHTHITMDSKTKADWIVNLKHSFEKYRGDNHWMKRPAVLRKVIDSSAKYKGEQHWFHTRPKSLAKLRRTWKLKQEII